MYTSMCLAVSLAAITAGTVMHFPQTGANPSNFSQAGTVMHFPKTGANPRNFSHGHCPLSLSENVAHFVEKYVLAMVWFATLMHGVHVKVNHTAMFLFQHRLLSPLLFRRRCCHLQCLLCLYSSYFCLLACVWEGGWDQLYAYICMCVRVRDRDGGWMSGNSICVCMGVYMCVWECACKYVVLAHA